METNQQNSGTATDSTGQQVETGHPHQPLPNERQRQQDQAGDNIDMNPGEPARPYVGGEEPKQAGTRPDAKHQAKDQTKS
jgi:hypothetical protein